MKLFAKACVQYVTPPDFLKSDEAVKRPNTFHAKFKISKNRKRQKTWKNKLAHGQVGIKKAFAA